MAASAAHILDALADRVLLCDGGIGSAVEACKLDVARDLQGHAHLPDILCLSRPDLVREIHESHLRTGADMVETNSFSAAAALGEIGLADRIFELNRRAAEIAREALERHAGDGRPRFVLGAVGPGKLIPALGQVAVATLTEGYADQCRGLVAGGVDAILIETCQDLLQIEAAIGGARRASGEVPIFVQVSSDATGGLLYGGDLAAVAALLDAGSATLFGLNCAAGPDSMVTPLGWLAAHWDGLVSVQPSAGLPAIVAGHARYPIGAEIFAAWQERFVSEFGANLIGGCCGTDATHIAALDAMLCRMAQHGNRPRPVQRSRGRASRR